MTTRVIRSQRRRLTPLANPAQALLAWKDESARLAKEGGFAWKVPQPNDVGTGEFLAMCELLGCDLAELVVDQGQESFGRQLTAVFDRR